MVLTARHTRRACYLGYITQAIIVNLPPLLFLTFQRSYGVTLGQLSLMISVTFMVQMGVDLLAAKFVDKIGYRPCAIAAHLFTVAGLASMSLLPLMMPAFPGLIVGTVLAAIGGGLLEVIVSPIIESIPSDNKAGSMSLLHAFYCWGQVGVVLLSTLFFVAFGTGAWQALTLLWALLPLMNLFLFAKVPMFTLEGAGRGMPAGQLLKKPVFWLFVLLMASAGASEQAMAQWASLFAEGGLGVSKAMGDLLGPCAFALAMGIARTIFGTVRGLSIHKALFWSGALCVVSYLIVIFAPWPVLSLMGCALCGLAVGLMWPGTLSCAAARLPAGGTALFALMALSGDVGCTLGPAVVGAVSEAVTAGGQAALKAGFLAALVFPLALMAGVALLRGKREKEEQRAQGR